MNNGLFKRSTLYSLLIVTLALLSLVAVATVTAAEPEPEIIVDPAAVRAAALASGLDSLDTVSTPEVDNLSEFLNDGPAAREAAVQMGKAFFWDMQAGSDGQACASCHFHAGADSRSRNQINPGLKAGDTLFGNNTLGVPGFPQFQPDYSLLAPNFPLHVLADPEENNYNLRVVKRDTNDVISSMGAFPAYFGGVVAGQSFDLGTPFADPVFNRQTPSASQTGKNVRRVEPRNTPTVINSVFNHSNFWDGRAHNLFNGVSVIGPLDPAAMIWVNNGSLTQQQVSIPNSSLASQAVGPVLSDLEMSFFNRNFPAVGQKLLSVTPLGLQLVDTGDSLLGPLSNQNTTPGATGLGTTYSDLIQQSFRPEYWNGGTVTLTEGTFTQMEANFTLFWGLAVQLYETSLVSDDSPFDRFMTGDDSALSDEELQGLLVFMNRGADPETGGSRNPAELDEAIGAAGVEVGSGNCVSCHGGPEFTDAAFTSLEDELLEIEETTVLENGLLAVGEDEGILDNGFSNIGVRPTSDDPGRGGIENGFPLSFTRQMLGYPDLLDGVIEEDDLPCDPDDGDCPSQLLVDGAFKIPGLRNVDLTGPYFHNGGQVSLEQVVEFYDRQGDFGDANISHLDRNMAFVDLDEIDEEPLIEFLLTLTDDRVRWEQAPFDHPQLIVPNGGTYANPASPILIPAVGAGGRMPLGLSPLGTFLGVDQD